MNLVGTVGSVEGGTIGASLEEFISACEWVQGHGRIDSVMFFFNIIGGVHVLGPVPNGLLEWLVDIVGDPDPICGHCANLPKHRKLCTMEIHMAPDNHQQR